MCKWCKAHHSESLAKCGSRMGRQFEEFFERNLWRMQILGLIDGFERHPPLSPEDHDGRDFTVRKFINRALIEKSVGVTISARSRRRAQKLHPHIKVISFKKALKTSRIKMANTVLRLFYLPALEPSNSFYSMFESV